MLVNKGLRRFALDFYDPAVIEKFMKAGQDFDIDGRSLYNFSAKELKKRISPEI